MKSDKPGKFAVWKVCLLIAVPLVVLFWKCFLPDYVHFSNDGPLGIQHTDLIKLPQGFFGQWFDINSIGWNGGAAVPDADALLRWAIGPVGYAKFYIPIALFVLGMGAYFFFRRSGMTASAAVLGGLAACLVTNYFSDACWGAAPAVFAFGMDFFALGAMARRDSRLPFWVAPALAGLAVGVNVMEAADIGALFSLVVAAFILYRSVVESESSPLAGAAAGVGRTFIVAVFALFISAYSIMGLIGIGIKGISGTKQDVQSKAAKWDFASQWSLPKRETLSLFIPGLFGDRVDFNDERAYWGGMGRDAGWEHYYHDILQPGEIVTVALVTDREQTVSPIISSNGELTLPVIGTVKAAGLTEFELQKKLDTAAASASLKGAFIPTPQGFQRHTGRGFYLGIVVLLVALWTALQSLRKNNSVFTTAERKLIWFWSVAAFISLLIAHGRFSPFAPFYYWLYTVLPYSSTVRSPEKLLHVVTFATIILFAYGVHGLGRRYIEVPFAPVPPGMRLKSWWAKAGVFDRRWVVGSVFALVLAVIGWIVYATCRPALEQYLTDVLFPSKLVHAISAYSLQQVGWFILFLAAGSAVLLLIFSGAFAGRNAKWAFIFLGVVMAGDLIRADLPFVVFWNYKVKYEVGELNPIVKFLADKPYEHRVAQLPFKVPDEYVYFQQLYGIEWAQQLFPFYNIQTLDIVQLSRMPQDLEAFELAQRFPGTPSFTRRLELTNTRYLLGPAGYLDVLNQQLDPVLHRFQIVSPFVLAPKPGVEGAVYLSEITAVPVNAPPNNGQPVYALFQFAGALPRASLYSNWETNSPAALSAFTTNGLDDVQTTVLDMVGTNDFLTLKKLMSPSFDPAKAVLVDEPVAAPTVSATNQSAGTVEYTSYAPADIKLKATATTPSILLLNDRYDPNWQVYVDGKPAELLRCNYIMRGVQVPAGQHDVEFQFRLPVKMLYINIAAVVVGIALLGYVAIASRKQSEPEPTPRS